MYVVPAASELVGVNVATVSVLFERHGTRHVFPLGSFSDERTPCSGTTGLVNVAVGAAETGLLDEPAVGRDAGHRRGRSGWLRGIEDHVNAVAGALKVAVGKPGPPALKTPFPPPVVV